MIITVVNMSDSIEDAAVLDAIRAINRQFAEDFFPYWSFGATLRLEGKSKPRPDRLHLPDMRGDAVLYLWDKPRVKDALGYHDLNARGIPFGFVFSELSEALGESWTVTLSHEAMELAADPLVNLLVAGPHPTEERTVFHWFEMSDAVQDESYRIDGIAVSNFVLPLYFTPDAENGSRNDFLCLPKDDGPLTSFGINRGGYIGFFDPKLDGHVTYAPADDARAKQRLEIKKHVSVGRRSFRTGGWPREQLAAAGSRSHVERVASPVAAAHSAHARTGRRFVQIDGARRSSS